MAPSQPDIIVTIGDYFAMPVVVESQITSTDFEVLSVNPSGPTWTIRGEYATTFAAGKTFRVSGNGSPQANGVYTVSSVAESGGNTTITLASATTYAATAVDTSTDSWTVSGDRLLVFYRGQQFFVTGNAGAASNKQYTVKYSYLSGSSTVIVCEEDIPSTATVSGSLYVPRIPASATAGGVIRRVANDPLDLADYTITAQIRAGKSNSSDLIANFTVVETDAAAGEFELRLAAATTADLEAGVYYWDCKLDGGSGTVPLRIPSGGFGQLRVRDRVTS